METDPLMSSHTQETAQSPYNVIVSAEHTLHQCRTVEEFRSKFAMATGCPVEQIADHVVLKAVPKALFLVGSLPLGMGASGSDVDLIVLVDDRSALIDGGERAANSDQRLAFSSETDLLLAGIVLTLKQGIPVEVQVALTPGVQEVYRRLRRRGPDLNEVEIRTLGRLSTGWQLWQTEGYLEKRAVDLNDRSLAIYCSTKNFVQALLQQIKAGRVLERGDIPLALHLGRLSIEYAYLAYFASEGLPHLGSKWLAHIGFAGGAEQRLARDPLLKEGISLLFPTLSSPGAAAQYLRDVSKFVASMRGLIERRPLFRIAYAACAQIAAA